MAITNWPRDPWHHDPLTGYAQTEILCINEKKADAITLYGDDALTAAVPSRQGFIELKLKNGRVLPNFVKATAA